MPRSLATRISAAATSRTWVTPPAQPSTSALADGLHGVDDQQRRASTASTWPSTAAEVGLGGEVELVAQRADAVGPQPHLRGGLLAGDVERPAALGEPRAATSSSSVDLPTPGSPASSTTAPGTSPPPSTRSSSSTPVRPARAASDVDLGRSAGPAVRDRAGRRRADRRRRGVSSTVPQAWHSPQRPTHLAVVQPHSAQRKDGRSRALRDLGHGDERCGGRCRERRGPVGTGARQARASGPAERLLDHAAAEEVLAQAGDEGLDLAGHAPDRASLVSSSSPSSTRWIS